jgi:hypothetical protein
LVVERPASRNICTASSWSCLHVTPGLILEITVFWNVERDLVEPALFCREFPGHGRIALAVRGVMIEGSAGVDVDHVGSDVKLLTHGRAAPQSRAHEGSRHEIDPATS